MKLAAIDIGTNSIHMIIAKANGRRNFEIVEREKEMAKLGAGVFASNYISDRAYQIGIETITRYVRLADSLDVDEIITAATSAIREAHNGEDFLNEVVARTGLCPRIISGKEEARLIFLAVRNSIALEGDRALVLDIGGGSTEAVLGDRAEIFFRDSMPLGVLRLLDMFADKGSVGSEGQGVLEAHIRFVARQIFEQINEVGFERVIGTSGTIRTMGEASLLAAGSESLNSVNSEIVQLKDINSLSEKLLDLNLTQRSEIEGISTKRADAIHLGGLLLVQLLQMAKVEEITLCDASLREGMILDYLERHAEVPVLPETKDLRHRKAAYLVHKYESDWEQNCHVANLALQLFDRTQEIHQYGEFERGVLEFASLLHDIGQFISFRQHHKNSRYIIGQTDPRGFLDEEILLIKHLARYHCKAKPKKKHKQFNKLSKRHRRTLKLLAGILRIAVALNKTKNQQVKQISGQITEKTIKIAVAGSANMDMEIWSARRTSEVLASALKRKVEIEKNSERSN